MRRHADGVRRHHQRQAAGRRDRLPADPVGQPGAAAGARRRRRRRRRSAAPAPATPRSSSACPTDGRSAELDRFIAAAEAAADVAGAVIRPFFRAGFATDTEGRPLAGDHRRPHRRTGDARRADRALPRPRRAGRGIRPRPARGATALGARPDRRHARLHHRPADLRHPDRAVRRRDARSSGSSTSR